MLTFNEKTAIYDCVKKQFPDTGLYRISKITECLAENGWAPERLGYASFRELALELKEMFTFQDDNNNVFIKTERWLDAEQRGAGSAPAGGDDFGSGALELNDENMEVSVGSLFALTKILNNGLSVEEMRQRIYDCFNSAKENGKLTFLADKYIFPIGVCDDGRLVNGFVRRNFNVRGKIYYFSFEQTHIYCGDDIEVKRREVTLPDEVKDRIYDLLTSMFPVERSLHMATISKALAESGIDKAALGFIKMKELLERLDFLELNDVVLGGVPQVMVVIHPREGYVAPHSVKSYAAGTGDIPELRLEEFCNLPPKPLDIIRRFLEENGRIQDIYGIRHDLSEDFEKARAEKSIRCFEQKIVFPCRYLREDGTPVEITLKPSASEGRPWFVYYVDTLSHEHGLRGGGLGRQLENFAFLGSWPNFLADLADKAIDEEWDFQSSGRKNFQILIQYVKYTFCRLKNEGKVCISSDRMFAAFNTGLVDKHYDDIYACFVPNDPTSDTPWKFTGFCTAASRGLGKMLVNYFNPLPQPPRYFNNSSDLFYDLDKQLHPDFDHIIIDNIKRLPIKFLADQFSDNRPARELCEKISVCSDKLERNEMYRELKQIISDNSSLFIRIQNRIKDAIELTKKRVRWNYKTAIPSYYPKRNSMSLMLPLCLSEDEKPDVALVVELMQSGNYQGQTILTIPQAYIDARLVCRLSSDWLNPSQITLGSEENEESENADNTEEEQFGV